MSKTLANVRTEVSYRLADAFSIWTAAEIDDYIKEGYNRLVADAKILWKTDTPTALQDVAGTATYTLPSDLLQIETLRWNSWRVVPMSAYEFGKIDAVYRIQQGDVRNYMIESDGLLVLRKIRIPATTWILGMATETVIDYYYRGADLASNNFEIPDRFCKYIRFYALSRCYERRGRGQNPKLSDYYRLRYDTGVAKVKMHKATYLSARVGVMGVGFNRSGLGPPRPRLPWNFGKVVR